MDGNTVSAELGIRLDTLGLGPPCEGFITLTPERMVGW